METPCKTIVFDCDAVMSVSDTDKHSGMNVGAFFAASEDPARLGCHALRKEFVREHVENVVWHERQPGEPARCGGFEHTPRTLVAASTTTW
jgi:hypothetical protein